MTESRLFPSFWLAGFESACHINRRGQRLDLVSATQHDRELDADFEPEAFAHVALYDERDNWIEMRLRATRAMRVRIAALDLSVEFAEGEQMRTEISAKFRLDGLRGELAGAGFTVNRSWTDPAGDFSLLLAEV